MSNNISMKTDAASVFAKHFAETKYDDLPGNLTEVVKRSTLDLLGVSLAASTKGPGCRELAEIALEGAGKQESTLIAFGTKVPAWMAAFVNGGLAHGIDFDDVYHGGLTHPSGSVIPAAFSIAERNAPISGKDFITAVSLGHDMVMRMTSSLEEDMNIIRNWSRFGIMGGYAAAATCGKLLKFDENKIHSALGINLCFSSGVGETGHSNLRGLYNSWSAKGAVLSAMMAEKGITGPAHPLEGERGFFKVFFQGKYYRNILLGDLGKKYYGDYLGYKPWPSCTSTLPSVDATLRLVEDNDIHPQDIKEIRVFTGIKLRKNYEPLVETRQPRTILEAKYSIPFTLALVAVKRRDKIADFTEEGIKDPKILAIAQKVVPVEDAKFDIERGVAPSTVEIETQNGKKYTKRVEFVYGHYLNPMSMEAIINKFMDCASYSVKSFSQKKLKQVVDTVLDMENLDDVGQIIGLLK